MPQPAWICDLGRVPYEPTAALQRSLRAAREAGAVPDVLLVLEHEPVITTGYRTDEREVAYARTLGLPVVPTERGGKATYHGPGQIVVYPILDLRQHGEDIRRFVRTLEAGIIQALGEFGLTGERDAAFPGVWVDGRKVASVGVRVTRWVSLHGIALNVDLDLAPFGWFTPCGIEGVKMTSVAEELGAQAPDPRAVREVLVAALCEQFELSARPVDRDDVAVVAADFPVPDPDLGPPVREAAPVTSTGAHTLLVGHTR